MIFRNDHWKFLYLNWDIVQSYQPISSWWHLISEKCSINKYVIFLTSVNFKSESYKTWNFNFNVCSLFCHIFLFFEIKSKIIDKWFAFETVDILACRVSGPSTRPGQLDWPAAGSQARERPGQDRISGTHTRNVRNLWPAQLISHPQFL